MYRRDRMFLLAGGGKFYVRIVTVRAATEKTAHNEEVKALSEPRWDPKHPSADPRGGSREGGGARGLVLTGHGWVLPLQAGTGRRVAPCGEHSVRRHHEAREGRKSKPVPALRRPCCVHTTSRHPYPTP